MEARVSCAYYSGNDKIAAEIKSFKKKGSEKWTQKRVCQQNHTATVACFTTHVDDGVWMNFLYG